MITVNTQCFGIFSSMSLFLCVKNSKSYLSFWTFSLTPLLRPSCWHSHHHLQQLRSSSFYPPAGAWEWSSRLSRHDRNGRAERCRRWSHPCIHPCRWPPLADQNHQWHDHHTWPNMIMKKNVNKSDLNNCLSHSKTWPTYWIELFTQFLFQIISRLSNTSD